MEKQKLVLIGNGMAGIRVVEEILMHNKDLFDITIIGREPHLHYNRVLLSSVLQGEMELNDIIVNSQSWYKENGIHLYTGETAVQIDIGKQTVTTDINRELTYDKLVIATGSSPFVPPIVGVEKEGVYGFRTIEDCQMLINATRRRVRKATVIGGGVLGLEAARGLVNLGMKVDVIHQASYIMQNQLDNQSAAMLQHELEQQGIRFLLEKETEAILGESSVKGVRFKDGTETDTDLVVLAAGVRPNIELAKMSDISVNRAIIVNDKLETNVNGIYAVGECAEHRGVVYGLIKPIYEQAEVLAKQICGLPSDDYKGSLQSTVLKIAGIDVFSAGKVMEDDTTTTIKLVDESAKLYKKAVFQADRLVGVILYGETNSKQKLLESLVKQRDISIVKKELLQLDEESPVASMGVETTVCQCNGVSKGMIIEAVQTYRLETVEDVKYCTKASGSCGGCKLLIEELLVHIANQEYQTSSKSFCSCTMLQEDEVVNEIQMKNLTSVKDVISALNWKNRDGCSSCRPAIDYYVTMIHAGFSGKMGEVDEKHRLCTIVPQMYGGITNAFELKRMSMVIEKYQIPQVFITNDQRIMLAGIDKEDLTNIKEELGTPLCLLQKQVIGSIKTCSCGQPDVMLDFAAELEKVIERLLLPAQVSIGMSSCLNDCIYASLQDIGVIRSISGFDIFVGGKGGPNPYAGELLVVARTLAEAGEFLKGFLQYYRESAHYREQIRQWIKRVGLIHIREVLFDHGLRHQLNKQLENAKHLERVELM
ncbi:nitrite reductase large subunit NirB [Bacillus changyiensis]|uniref:nitrite reductase large subunit NirB n=1 Tax=Bacillus changyiensis TaxID=3004103 RepID=UPI0022E02C56|nr:nitrite reductase large subunit NirB [Bacillus changyiensis]MDA1477843.1 nitrite reductase large subunit NirB [Bacillus changyiensis]